MSVRRPPRHMPRLRVVWSPEDFDDMERHAAEAIALTKAIHPATLSKQYADAERVVDSVFNTCRRAVVGDPSNAPEYDRPAPVFDLFTGRRLA